LTTNRIGTKVNAIVLRNDTRREPSISPQRPRRTGTGPLLKTDTC